VAEPACYDRVHRGGGGFHGGSPVELLSAYGLREFTLLVRK
jgi:hypothetical protein